MHMLKTRIIIRVIKGRLKNLAGWIASKTKGDS